MQILLVDREPAMVRAWRTAFEDRDDVEVVEGDYFSRPAEAMVSPANSFGIMDGGLDAAIRDVLGFAVQKRVQRVIVERHHGELPVGSAELVDTSDERWPVLIVAPTMRVPESVNQTLNAYLAFRAALLACKRADIASIVLRPRDRHRRHGPAALGGTDAHGATARDRAGANPVVRSDPCDPPRPSGCLSLQLMIDADDDRC